MSTVTVTADIRDPATDAGTGIGGFVSFQLVRASAVGTIVYGNNQADAVTVVDGEFAAPVQLLAGVDWLITVQTPVWREQFQVTVPQTPATTSLGVLHDLAAPAPSQPALFVPFSALGAPLGLPGPLDAAGTLPALQVPHLSQLAKGFAGLSDPDVITDFQPGMDPNISITLAAGTYINKRFVCSVLHIPNPATQLINCDIQCFNVDRGVRFDEDGGVAQRRRLEHCRIQAAGTATNGSGFDLLLCEVVNNGDDSMRLGRGQVPTTAVLCWFHDFRPPSGAHTDGIQMVTWPAADVILVGCVIDMAPALDYVMPVDAGFTGAVFYDPTDVAIAITDPEPHRRGMVRIDQCELSTTQNYPVVIDQDGVLMTNCIIHKGTTDYVSNPNDSVIAGWNNRDPDGTLLTGIDLGGYLPEPQTLSRLQDVDVLTTPPTNGKTLVYNDTTDMWEPGTASGSTALAQLGDVDLVTTPPADGDVLVFDADTGKWFPRAPIPITSTVATFAQRYFTTGDSPTFPNTAGVWSILLNAGATAPQYEVDIAAAVGDVIQVDFGGIRSLTNNTSVDLAVVVGSTIKRFMATGTANATGLASGGTGMGSGDDAWVPPGGSLLSRATSKRFTVAAADLDGANVRLCVVIATTTAAGNIQSNGNNPLYIEATRFRTTTVTV